MNALTQLQRPAGNVESERAASVYAAALLNVAREQNQVQEVLDDLQGLDSDILGKQPVVAEFLQSAIIGRDRKAELLHRAFGPDRIHPLLSQFLQVLNEHDRLNLIGSILVEAQRAALRHANKFLVDVVSAVELTETEKQRLEGLLRQITSAEPVTTYRLDPDLLGGVQIRTRSWLFDGSVSGRLQVLRQTLFERQP